MHLLFFNFLLFLTILSINAQIYNVRDFNATGDGITDDTLAIRKALAAATGTNGGRVIFDAGYTFLTGALNLTDNIILDVRGKILASLTAENYGIVPNPPWLSGGHVKQPVIYPFNVTNLTITGGGVIDGNGPYWYECMFNSSVPPCYPYGRPHLVQPMYSSNIRIENITLKDSPSWTLHLAWTTNVYINNVIILSPAVNLISKAEGINTDGIDVDCSVNVTIENSYYSGGDDAVVIKSGYNLDGRTNGRRSENIYVRNFTVGTSNGFAIGSESACGARNVTFQDITINGSLHAVLIKTMIGRGGTVEDITFNNFKIYNTNYTIELNMMYTTPGNDTTVPYMKNIIINNITSDNTGFGYNIRGLNNSKIQNTLCNFTRDCWDITGTCDAATVFPSCPPCLVQETICEDAINDCSLYLNYCNNQMYHATLCDLCRKSCNLCSSC